MGVTCQLCYLKKVFKFARLRLVESVHKNCKKNLTRLGDRTHLKNSVMVDEGP